MSRLKADRATGTLALPNRVGVSVLPEELWQYELGGKACIEHVLDGWRSRLRQPRHPTLRAQFPAPTAFTAQELDQLVDNVARMATVAVESMKIINHLATISPLNPANHPPGWKGPAVPPKPPAPAPTPPKSLPFVQGSFCFPSPPEIK